MTDYYNRSYWNSKKVKGDKHWYSKDYRTLDVGYAALWVNQSADSHPTLPILHGHIDIPLEQIRFAMEYQRWRKHRAWYTKELVDAVRFDFSLWEVDPKYFRSDNPPIYQGKIKYNWYDIENKALQQTLRDKTYYDKSEHLDQWETFRNL